MAFREGDRAASVPAPQWRRPAIFRRAPLLDRSHYMYSGALCIAKQNSRPSAILRFAPAAALRSAVQGRSARRLWSP